MLVNKAHKILLDITPEIEGIFISWCGTARWAYNYGLQRKIDCYRKMGTSPRGYALMKEVVTLKKTEEFSWLKDIPCSIPRMALLHLDTAYIRFFGRVKRGVKERGYPKFKSKKQSRMCFHIEPHDLLVKGAQVRIPRLGWVRMHQAIRFIGRLVGTVCISQRAGKWYGSFQVETEIADPIENQEKVVVGFDVGVKTLATLSDGKKFDNPKAFYRLEKLLARAQRQVTRKQKDSKRREKAKLRVQCVYKRIADLRANTTHQVSAYVAKNYSGVAIEDLNVQGMTQNRNLAKAIYDANMSELHRQLIYKMGWAGSKVRQVDRFFPSSKICNVCGCINNALTLADRKWICDCGEHHDRDVNAAINLANKCFGRGAAATARGGLGVIIPTDESRIIRLNNGVSIPDNPV